MRPEDKPPAPQAEPSLTPATEPANEPASDSAWQRWSRRKLAATAEPDVPADAQNGPTESPSGTSVPESAAPGDACTPPDLPDLPDLDTLDENSDYSAFLSPEVEASVRRVALRKLFGLPCFAERDGLDDYDDDFGSFEGLGTIVTHEMKRLAAQQLARQRQDDGELTDGISTAPGQPEPLADSTAEPAPQTPVEIPAEPPIATHENATQASVHSDHLPDSNSQEPSAHA